MIVENLSSTIEIKKYLQELGVDSGGVSILANKAKTHIVSIKNLHVGGANILKQDALSIGADLAVPRGTVLAKTPSVNTLLIATTAQLKVLAKKELAQPFGLKELAFKLKKISDTLKPKEVEIMGIINANDDSFFSDSRFLETDAIEKIEDMIAKSISPREELSRVEPILDLIKEKKLYEKVLFSIDSYSPLVIETALKSGFQIVNDITGLADDEVCKLCAAYNAKVVIMHMQGNPQTMQDNPLYENILDDVYTFFQERIKKAEGFGIKDIVLDIGIGFGKTLEDNLMLIKHLGHFISLDKQLLVGASRKSMIEKIDNSEVRDRLSGTLTLHLEAIRNGVSIIRVHDVFEHAQALKVQSKLDTI